MPVSRWSIKIIQLDANTVTFQPDQTGAAQGQPLGVNTGDNITWNNMTNNELQLVVTKITLKGVNQPLTQLFQGIRFQPGSASNPIFNVTQAADTVITYSCRNPAQQSHQIVVGSSTRPKNGGRAKGGGRSKGGGTRPKGGARGGRPKGGARPK
jgi:hypothetical protein